MKRKLQQNEKLAKALQIICKDAQFDDEQLIIRGIIGSTEAIDRSGDIIVQEGWELENYKKNPVILYGHDASALPVGKALEVNVVGTQLMFDVQFADTDFGKDVYRLVKNGFLNAFSVGFRTKEWTYDEELDAFKILKAELYELSVVPVPANQEALLARIGKALEGNGAKQPEEKTENETSEQDASPEENTEVEEKPKKRGFLSGLCGDCSKSAAECECGHNHQFAENHQDKPKFITEEQASKMIKDSITRALEQLKSEQNAESDQVTNEGGQNDSKSQLVKALEAVGYSQIKEANKATGKLLQAINKLNQSRKD